MRTLVVYSTKYGTTRSCAEEIARQLPGETRVADMNRERLKSLEGYDAVVIGGAIYAGKVMSGVPRFCERHREELLERGVGLFVCCLYEGETAQSELDGAFPPWLNAHALVRRPVGGAVKFEKLKAIDRYLVRKIAHITEDVRTVKDEELTAIADEVGGFLKSRAT